MSSSLNVWSGTGNLTRDPETKQTPSGKSVTTFGIGVNNGYGDKKSTMFLTITAWEKLGSIVQQYASKGAKVAVTGSLSCRTYTNKAGEEKQVWEINAREVELLSSKGETRAVATNQAPAATYNESGEINF
jgi:single-strand DNA-binding protein